MAIPNDPAPKKPAQNVTPTPRPAQPGAARPGAVPARPGAVPGQQPRPAQGVTPAKPGAQPAKAPAGPAPVVETGPKVTEGPALPAPPPPPPAAPPTP